MKKTILSTLLLTATCFSGFATEGSDEPEPSGFFTSMLNEAVASSMEAPNQSAPAASVPDDNAYLRTMTYGRTVTDFVSAPKFGGYVIGKYNYNDKADDHGGKGFTQRLVRFYVDGTILNDFAYRIQIQANNASFHMKDFFVEWKKYPAFKVKVGQFKRAFGFENPMNPWDISTGDYSLMTQYLTGHKDYLNSQGADASFNKTTGKYDALPNGGRDQGIQVQGDFLPVGADKHNLIHYQVMVSNGSGINVDDNDGKKDLTGTLQFQPIKGLYIGAFGWMGAFRSNTGNHSRNRYAFGVKYDANGYTFRSEYAHGQSDLGNADAWYAIAAAPVNDWFRVSAQYQQYRKDKTSEHAQTMYSFIPEFQLHKNLKLQLQYNYNTIGSDTKYNELWAELYFRF